MASPGRSGRRIWRNVFVDPPGPTPASGLLLVEQRPESCTGTELRHSLDLDPDRLPGLRIEALARLALHCRDVPKPVTCTLRPRLMALPMVTNSESTMRTACARGRDSCCEAIASMNSFLFTLCVPQDAVGAGECSRADGAPKIFVGLGVLSACAPRTIRHGLAARDETRSTAIGIRPDSGAPRWRTFPVPSSQRGCAPAFSCGTRPTHAHKEDTDGPSQAAARQG